MGFETSFANTRKDLLFCLEHLVLSIARFNTEENKKKQRNGKKQRNFQVQTFFLLFFVLRGVYQKRGWWGRLLQQKLQALTPVDYYHKLACVTCWIVKGFICCSRHPYQPPNQPRPKQRKKHQNWYSTHVFCLQPDVCPQMKFSMLRHTNLLVQFCWHCFGQSIFVLYKKHKFCHALVCTIATRKNNTNTSWRTCFFCSK